MKSAVKKSSIPENNAFLIKDLKAPFFDPIWHFHQEYQLFVVMKGKGTRFIGDSIKPFSDGDMVFTGPNLPHLWRSDEAYYEKNSNLETHGIVIYFNEKFLGDSLLNKEEMASVKYLFARANQGLEIVGNTNIKIKKRMKELLKVQGVESIIQLLKILNILSHSQEVKLISNTGYINSFKESDKHRMNIVHEHVMNNFKKNIKLEEVASIANMTPSSFSRYFSARANKSFSTFLSEIRTGHACKLLLEDNLSISQISYECGFRTLSNFNKQFKEITNTTPLKYKKDYLKVI